jgi:ribosomal protein S18 acetylase RimI-like enzyme
MKRVTESDLERCVNVLTQAFKDDVLSQFFFPEEKDRIRYLPEFFRYRVKYGSKFGQVYASSPNLEGVAIWRYPDSTNKSRLRDLKSGGFGLYLAVGRERIQKMNKLDDFTKQQCEKFVETPYIHLGPIGVHPDYQGQGFGSRLIRPMLEHLDASETYCYLETQNPANVELYKHYGFEVVSETTLPGTDIPHWDLMRTPR